MRVQSKVCSDFLYVTLNWSFFSSFYKRTTHTRIYVPQQHLSKSYQSVYDKIGWIRAPA